MKNNEKKNKAIDLYVKGMTMKQIADKMGCTRQAISKLIKNDDRVKEKRNKKVVTVYKYKKANKMNIYIPVSYLRSIGISNDTNVKEYVNISLENNRIIIEKHI